MHFYCKLVALRLFCQILLLGSRCQARIELVLNQRAWAPEVA